MAIVVSVSADAVFVRKHAFGQEGLVCLRPSEDGDFLQLDQVLNFREVQAVASHQEKRV